MKIEKFLYFHLDVMKLGIRYKSKTIPKKYEYTFLKKSLNNNYQCGCYNCVIKVANFCNLQVTKGPKKKFVPVFVLLYEI